MAAKRKLAMSINLNALEHLGINLYSNVPAVLSEIVANAWDADAENVSVTLESGSAKITIEDDGSGMDRDEVIDHFLMVGFKRRDTMGTATPKHGRRPMGRKGIGKLSSFSIARYVEVYTAKDGEKTAFRMDRDDMRAKIKKSDATPYEPDELDYFPTDLKHGTRIVLSGVSTNLTGLTTAMLKRRVARRFAVIGPKFDFSVAVDGEAITPADRGYHNALQYLWTYGDQKDFAKLCTKLERKPEDRTKALRAACAKAGVSIEGWIGTATKPQQLTDDEGDNLNRIAIFMRGKLAQEDVLDDFAQKEIYADYVIGELHCEELDEDKAEDIATSSRQAIKQDDPRFTAVKEIIRSELRHIAGKWSDWRLEDGSKQARSVPEVVDWLDSLQASTRKKAERWIGRLNVIRSQDDTDKKELLKASILAFESYRRKEDLDRLEKIGDESLNEVLNVFKEIDDLELSYYGQIVKLRLGIIRALKDKLAKNDKEHAIRDYLFDHLWLLDTSWERAKGTEHVETTVDKFLKENTKKLSKSDKKDRIDIGYRTASGKHIIVELKRANVSVPLDKLVGQIRKYRDGARKILDKTDYKSWPIEIVCVLGKPPPERNTATGEAGIIKALESVEARIVYYDQLLANAERAYADYLNEHIKVDKLWGIFKAIDNFAPQDKEEE